MRREVYERPKNEIEQQLARQNLEKDMAQDHRASIRPVSPVHVRRLRAKLGTDHEGLIGTVRNVGYRLTLTRLAEDELSEA